MGRGVKFPEQDISSLANKGLKIMILFPNILEILKLPGSIIFHIRHSQIEIII